MLDIVSKPIVDRNVRRNDNGHNGHDSLSHQVRIVTPPLYHHGPSQCPPQPHGPQRSQREGDSAQQDPQPGAGQHLLCQPGEKYFSDHSESFFYGHPVVITNFL